MDWIRTKQRFKFQSVPCQSHLTTAPSSMFALPPNVALGKVHLFNNAVRNLNSVSAEQTTPTKVNSVLLHRQNT